MEAISKNLCEIFVLSCQDSSGMRESSSCRRDAALFWGFFLHRTFARVSPVFAVALLAASGFVFTPLTSASTATAADPAGAVKRQAASSQFARAEDQRAALNEKPADKRTLADYKHVVDSYRRVYLITPHANEVPDALLQNSAPPQVSTNSLTKNEEAETAKPEPAPRVPAKEVPRDISVEVAKKTASPSGGSPAVNGRVPLIHKISAKAATDTTRVTIDLDGSVQYVSGRIANPGRIYFDLRAARLMPELVHAKIKTDGAMVSAVRVAQNPAGVVRVVLDVNSVKDYTASLLSKPNRLVIDLYANSKAMQPAEASGTAVADTPATGNPVVASVHKPAGKVQSAISSPRRTPNADTTESTAVIPQPKN